MIENGTKIDPIADMIKKHEGCSLKPYVDTVGVITIGYGRNIQHNGITQDEADYLFMQDYANAKVDALKFVGDAYWPALSDGRQAVIIDMAFNLGAKRLNNFVGFRQALREGRWLDAARHMRSSLWFVQVKKRAQRLTKMMETGKWS
jgi:lysozyme